VVRAHRLDAADAAAVEAPVRAARDKRPATKEAAIASYNSSYEVNKYAGYDLSLSCLFMGLLCATDTYLKNLSLPGREPEAFIADI
jgi:hypothetical protein